MTLKFLKVVILFVLMTTMPVVLLAEGEQVSLQATQDTQNSAVEQASEATQSQTISTPVSVPVIATTTFDSVAQTAMITSALKQYYGIDGSLELSAVKALAPLAVTPTSVEILNVPEAPSQMMLVKARYMKGHEVVGEINAPFRAIMRVGVLVPRCQVARATALNASDFDIQMMDRLAMHQAPVDPSTDLSSYETISPVPAGTALTWNFLKIQPLVRKGAIVDVEANEGGMHITTRALATQDAGKGQQVVMKNLTSNKKFEAYVINENLVQIRF